MAVKRELAMVEIALEDDEVRSGEMQEEIGRFSDEVPEGKASAPERLNKPPSATAPVPTTGLTYMLLIDPLALALILLPSLTHRTQGIQFCFRCIGEELTVDTDV